MICLALIIMLTPFVDTPKVAGIKLAELAVLASAVYYVPIATLRNGLSVKNRAFSWLMIFLAVAVVSIINSPPHPAEAEGYQWAVGIFAPGVVGLSYLFRLVMLMLLIIICSYVVRDKYSLDRALSILMISGGLISIYGIVQEIVFVLFKVQLNRTFDVGDVLGLNLPIARISGFTFEPAAFATYLNCCMLPFVAFYMFKKYFISKAVTFICIMAYLAALFLTFSTGGWIAFLIAITAVFAAGRKHAFFDRKAVIAIAGGLLLLAMPILFGDGLAEQYFMMHVTKLGTEFFAGIRFTAQESALNVFLNNPLTGVGIGKFPLFFSSFRNFSFTGVDEYDVEKMSAMNDYLQVAAETGILGVIAMFVLLIISVREFKGFLRGGETMRIYGISLFSGALATFVQMAGGLIIYMSYFWMVLALMFQVKKIGYTDAHRP